MSCERPQRVQIAWWWWTRVAADVGVVAVGQVDPLDEPQVREHVERPEDRRPPDPQAPAARVVDEVGGREVALARGDEVGDRAARLGQPVAGVVEGGDQRLGGRHATASSADARTARRRASIPRGPSTIASRNRPVWTSTIVAPLATSSQYER